MKDPLDLSLIVTDLHLPPSRDVWAVVAGVFARYASHEPSPSVLSSPGDWRDPCFALTTATAHPVTDMDAAVTDIQRFLDKCRLRY